MTRINLVQTRRPYNITSAEFSPKLKELNLSYAAVVTDIKEELEKNTNNRKNELQVYVHVLSILK